MRVTILGIDGYLGFVLAMYLTNRGHKVSGVDNFLRRKMVKEVGSHSATPIQSMSNRVKHFKKVTGKEIKFYYGDLLDSTFVDNVVKKERPECIVHLGEIPSAPYSMKDRQNCAFVMHNNIIGTINVLFSMNKYVPNSHLLKLGTMGEYGTPNIDIPEGFFDIEYRGRKDRLPFPRQPGSYYHLTKVHDSLNVEFACKIWGLCSTDIMQGVVHGIVTDDMVDDKLLTRYDFDEVFGTALNRFCAQAVIGHKLTPYGIGKQTRGYIALRDSMQCLTIALENPPDDEEYRVFNQLSDSYSANELAEHVADIGAEFDLDVEIHNIENPRIEREEHYYNPDVVKLPLLGFRPTYSLDDELRITIPKLMKYRKRIEAKREHILPSKDFYWRKNKGSR